jgi:hypothetical protein
MDARCKIALLATHESTPHEKNFTSPRLAQSGAKSLFYQCRPPFSGKTDGET